MSRRTGNALVVVAGLCVLLAVVLIGGSSPVVCGRCHTSLLEATARSPHESVSCYGCHARGTVALVTQKSLELLDMYPSALLGRVPDGPAEELPRGVCGSCHAEVLRGVVRAASGISIDHSACAPGATCDDCHAATAHAGAMRWAGTPVMEDCVACHLAEHAPVGCDACHAPRKTEERLGAPAWRTTHGSDWERAHGGGRLELCVMCHASGYCVRCHGVDVPHTAEFGRTHGTASLAPGSSCSQCHRSAAFCDTCHGTPMPHPVDFAKQHGEIAGTIDAPLCLRCHDVPDCRACHGEHVHKGGGVTATPVPDGGDG